MARPSEYKVGYNEQMLKYFEQNDPFYKEEITVETAESGSKVGMSAKTQTKWEYRANKLPTFEKFASIIGVHRETLDNWANDYSEFFDTYKKCKQIQQDFLVQNGLLGLYQSNFAIFVAQNYTGLKQKTNTDITTNGKDINPKIEIEIIDKTSQIENTSD